MENRAIEIVKEYALRHLANSDSSADLKVHLLWQCKVFQNWKFLLSTSLSDDKYYELNYDGNKKVWHLDIYKKVDDCCIIYIED